ncbi:MAG: hypothetical protein MI867_07735 [Pseudomonadales bacterium]|nr:hypothetical protein [Pseudomonadales bacterium]
MPRPSLKESRREEILDAFERCILRDGLPTCSLEDLATEANMKRSILRHYIGNRDDIILALAKRRRDRFKREWQQLDKLPEKDRVYQLLNLFFAGSDESYYELEQIIVNDALFAEAKRLPELAQQITAMLEDFVDHFSAELQRAFPKAPKQQCVSAAHGIQANYLLLEAIIPLEFSTKKQYFHHLKRAAKLQVDYLASLHREA